MIPGQGLLHVVPVPQAMAYVLLRPLLSDVPEDELCGVAPGRVLPINEQWHPHLIAGLCSIPALEAGDSVWWHCDVIHAVAPVEDQQGWGNVMYIPAAPMCEKTAPMPGGLHRPWSRDVRREIFRRKIMKQSGTSALRCRISISTDAGRWICPDPNPALYTGAGYPCYTVAPFFCETQL